MIPIISSHYQTHILGGNLGILRLSRKDEIIVTELNKCVNCDSVLGIHQTGQGAALQAGALGGPGVSGAQNATGASYMVGQGEYCRHCCFYYERRPGAISGMLSVNGMFGAGSGVQHDRKEPGAGTSKDQGASGSANQGFKEKGGASGGMGFPVLSRMHINDLMELGVIDNVNEDQDAQ